jgi:hypothetical protein
MRSVRIALERSQIGSTLVPVAHGRRFISSVIPSWAFFDDPLGLVGTDTPRCDDLALDVVRT